MWMECQDDACLLVASAQRCPRMDRLFWSGVLLPGACALAAPHLSAVESLDLNYPRGKPESLWGEIEITEESIPQITLQIQGESKSKSRTATGTRKMTRDRHRRSRKRIRGHLNARCRDFTPICVASQLSGGIRSRTKSRSRARLRDRRTRRRRVSRHHGPGELIYEKEFLRTRGFR